MSTIEDFENAKTGDRAVKGSFGYVLSDDDDMVPWKIYKGGDYTTSTWMSSEELAKCGFTLDPSPKTPTTAREALALAWELAYPIKEWQRGESGTELIARFKDGDFKTYRAEKSFDGGDVQRWAEVRSLDPLPEPEPELPDWLDADAVVACKDTVVDVWTHCISHPHDDGSGWTRRDPDSCTHWTELEHVTPLYPKKDA